MAVAVVIDERRARRPLRIAQPRLRGRVGERAVAVVVQERDAAERGDEQIEIAVVVVVADRDAHAVRLDTGMRLLGHVRELQRPPLADRRQIVAKESRRFRAADVARGQRAALHDEDIEIAVVVVVEQGDARAHHLGQVVVAGRAVDVREGQSSVRRGFDEERIGGRDRFRC